MSDRRSRIVQRHPHLADACDLLALLSGVSRALESSRDFRTGLEEVTRLLVPALADWCVVYLVEEDGAIREAAMAHADPSRVSWAREWEIGFPYDAHHPRGPCAVLTTGATQLYPEVSDELLIDAARFPEQLEALRQAGFSSCMVTPLRAGGRVLGAIAFAAAESGVHYREDDARLAEELALRVAAAAEIARLRQEAEGVVKERRQAAEGLRAIASRARCLLWYAEVEARGRRLHWRLWVADEEAARRFLPVEVPPGYSYGQALAEARLPEDRARMGWGDKQVRAGRSYRQEFRVRDAFGNTRWLAEDVQIEAAGPKCWHAVGVCVDITERRRLEEELRQRAEALAEADRRKDEFLAMLAHELRNPLAAITNSLGVLQHPGADRAGRERALDVLDRQVRHQGRMVEDLLDVSRISRGRVELRQEPLDLAALLCETVEDYGAAFRQAGVTLKLALPPDALPIIGDRVRLAQIFGNLLSNALKFTPAGERVTVTVERGAVEAEVRIRDTGGGIPSDLLPHVFDAFIQGDRSLARTQGGLGLGLALVRGLVQLHGGSVAASSDGPGRGAEFVVRLPLLRDEGRAMKDESSDPEDAHPSSLRPHPSPRRVLVVEDNRDAAETTRDLLELAGYTVDLASSGPEGIWRALESRPDIVLCDIGLPGVDGYAVAAALRQDPATAGVRLIALSGYGQDRDRQRSQEAGFDHHLVKPVAPQALLDLLASDSR